MGCVGAEVKEAVLVHGGCLEDGHIRTVFFGHIPVEAGQLRIAHGAVEGKALGNGFSLDAAHMPGVPGEVVSRVFDLEDLGDPHEDAAAEVDVIKLRKPFGDLRIHSHRSAGSPGVIDPVAGFYGFCRFAGGHKLVLIHFSDIHGLGPHF